jgi:hypothetical protein
MYDYIILIEEDYDPGKIGAKFITYLRCRIKILHFHIIHCCLRV